METRDALHLKADSAAGGYACSCSTNLVSLPVSCSTSGLSDGTDGANKDAAVLHVCPGLLFLFVCWCFLYSPGQTGWALSKNKLVALLFEVKLSSKPEPKQKESIDDASQQQWLKVKLVKKRL